PPMREGERMLRSGAENSVNHTEALRHVAEQHDDPHAPFVANAGQHRTDGATVLARAIGKLGSHLYVLRYQICAFLRTLAAVYNLIQVTDRYLPSVMARSLRGNTRNSRCRLS